MIKNQRGQAAIEYILITIIFFGIGSFIISKIRSESMIQRLATGPNDLLKGMVESGTWETSQKAKASHPGLLLRHVSIDPNSGGL